MSFENSNIIYEILAYLDEHKKSGDTFEGIVEWWLLEGKIKYHTAKVKNVLAELVKKGLLIAMYFMHFIRKSLRAHLDDKPAKEDFLPFLLASSLFPWDS